MPKKPTVSLLTDAVTLFLYDPAAETPSLEADPIGGWLRVECWITDLPAVIGGSALAARLSELAAEHSEPHVTRKSAKRVMSAARRLSAAWAVSPAALRNSVFFSPEDHSRFVQMLMLIEVAATSYAEAAKEVTPAERKERIASEAAFLLRAYGIPLTVYKDGVFARTLQALYSETGLDHLFPSKREKAGSIGPKPGSDLTKILRAQARAWTDEKVKVEIMVRRSRIQWEVDLTREILTRP